jgi:hypothetical protein
LDIEHGPKGGGGNQKGQKDYGTAPITYEEYSGKPMKMLGTRHGTAGVLGSGHCAVGHGVHRLGQGLSRMARQYPDRRA